jgi:type I restriction enzyme, S subunit
MNWLTGTLNDIFIFENGKGITRNKIKDKGNYPIMGANGVIGYTDKFLYNKPINIIGRVGSSGEVHRSDKPCWVSDNAIVAKSNEKSDDLFNYYLLKGTNIKQIVIGSTQPLLTQSGLKTIPIKIPPIEVQKKIASYLNKFDEKIITNLKINKQIEEIAGTIFKSWFIDFNPVRAKNEGRYTGLSKEISDLFPDSFEDTEIGEIPKGFVLSKLGDHIKISKGKSYKSNELKDSDTALVTLKSFERNGGYREDGLKEYIGSFKEEQIVKEGDLIVAFTDVTQSADVIGKPAIIIDNQKYTNLVISLDVGVVRTVDQSPLSKSFIYFLMLSKRYASNSLGYTNGTNVLHLDKKAITDFMFCLPNNELLERFDLISKDILKKISLNTHENKVLTSLKNIFLPKLISGELNISNKEKEVIRENI